MAKPIGARNMPEVNGVSREWYGTFWTMVMLGRLVGTFEPPLVKVITAHYARREREDKNGCAKPAAREVGRQECQGTSHLSAIPAKTASAHAIDR
jgi:hypothetical protein